MEINRVPRWFSGCFPNIIWHHQSPNILLTFDDGIDPVWTPKYLDLLEKYSLKAIFFVVGNSVTPLVKEIQSLGHQIGWHTKTHRSFFRLNPTEIRAELEAVKQLEDMVQNRIRLFRFPYGHFFPWQIKYVLEKEMFPVMWSYMIHEYKQKSVAELVSKMHGLSERDIFLFHDKSENSEHAYTALKLFLSEHSSLFSDRIDLAFVNKYQELPTSK